MTLNKIWIKLKKNNKQEYTQFQFCLTLSMLLIASYLVMLFSPLVQNTLPDGGDTRKQINFIFGIAVAGCTIFAIYATGLFLRYKSRVIGVFLALGTEKSRLSKALAVEVGSIAARCSVSGIVLGCAISFLIGKLFEGISARGNDNHFAFTAEGIGFSALYCLLLAFCIAVMVFIFMKRSNIMDIINEQRKQEPLKKIVTKAYLIKGILAIVVGVAVGLLLPFFVTRVFEHWLGAWTNMFYLLAVFGLYRIMVYSVAVHKKGGNPQKYYKNMISYGIVKFQGGSVVRNMLVIALLIMGGLFAAFYMPMSIGGIPYSLSQYESGYAYWYPTNADEVSREDLEAIAGKHQITIANYRSSQWIQVVGNGFERDDFDEKGNLIELYHDEYAVYECISASGYQALTGKNIKVADGEYLHIQTKEAMETVYSRFGDMNQLFCKESQSYLPMRYAGRENYNSLVTDYGFDSASRFIISDNDYERLKAGLPAESLIEQVLFDTRGGEGEIPFSEELYKEYALRASENMQIAGGYDSCAAKRAGESYAYLDKVSYDANRPEKETDWQYTPIFVELATSNSNMQYAIFYLMLLYVAVICLAAVSIIAYTRSQSVGIRNKQVFADIEKLGANHAYLHLLLKKQISKIYVLPTAVGSLLLYAFLILLFWQNDGRLMPFEGTLLIEFAFITLGVAAWQYLLYRLSIKRVSVMLE